MTREEAREFCDDTDIILDFYPPKFTFEDIQAFLESWGYQLVGHEALAKVQDQRSEDVSVYPVGQPYDAPRKRLFAVPVFGKADLPDRVDSAFAVEMDFRTVFQREFKQRLYNALLPMNPKIKNIGSV